MISFIKIKEEIQKYLDRRKPGQSSLNTKRKEQDQVIILSGFIIILLMNIKLNKNYN